jgi:energy-coupling factor transporter ATP-binding protein EcfA2
MFVDPATIIELAAIGARGVQENAKLRKLFRKLRYRITKGRMRVVVFGPSGTGKSTLGQFLAGQIDTLSPVKYLKSLETFSYSLQADVVCTLIVPGGEPMREQLDWPGLYRELGKGRIGGVINVVSYGYHTFAERSIMQATPRQGGTITDMFSAYLEDRRQRELEIIASLVPHLSAAPNRIAMLTVVTKQDLWWKDRDQVAAFYERGNYNTYINDLRHKRGGNVFMHDYVPASLVLSNMETANHETLALTAEGYDQNLHRAYQHNLLSQVVSMANRYG